MTPSLRCLSLAMLRPELYSGALALVPVQVELISCPSQVPYRGNTADFSGLLKEILH